MFCCHGDLMLHVTKRNESFTICSVTKSNMTAHLLVVLAFVNCSFGINATHLRLSHRSCIRIHSISLQIFVSSCLSSKMLLTFILEWIATHYRYLTAHVYQAKCCSLSFWNELLRIACLPYYNRSSYLWYLSINHSSIVWNLYHVDVFKLQADLR